MDQIRVDQQNLPKKERYGIGELLKTIDLKRPTYYDERKRIINKNDKYADVKVVIKEIAENNNCGSDQGGSTELAQKGKIWDW